MQPIIFKNRSKNCEPEKIVGKWKIFIMRCFHNRSDEMHSNLMIFLFEDINS